jgi:hypothetical protein
VIKKQKKEKSLKGRLAKADLQAIKKPQAILLLLRKKVN